jgi:hypothetical protein
VDLPRRHVRSIPKIPFVPQTPHATHSLELSSDSWRRRSW